MGSEWPKARLGDVATIIMGQSPPGSTYNEDRQGLPFFQGVKDFSSRFPRERVYCTDPRRIAEAGDILFSVRAPIGKVNRAATRCCIGRGLAAIRGESGRDTDFLQYALQAISHEWSVLENQGAVFGNAKKTDLENLRVPWPPARERHAIAHVLSTLDDKIEQFRRMNGTLEAIAWTIFKSWFVHFDPVIVNALRAGNPIPEKFATRAAHYRENPAALGLPDEILRIFPDSFRESEDAPVPAGWEIDVVYWCADVVYGAPFKSRLFNDRREGMPLIRIRDLRTQDPQVWTTEVLPRGYLVQEGDILVGMDGEFRPCLWIGKEGWLNQRVCCFRPRDGVPRSFVYYGIADWLAFFERAKTGTTVIHLGKRDIDTFRVIRPPMSVLDAFGEATTSLEASMLANARAARIAKEIRDTLLPRLISGELRIPDAERILEESA